MNALAHKLTDEEIAVLKGWCEGLSNWEVRNVSFRDRSMKAVEAIGTRLKQKLQAANPRHACYLWGRNEDR